MNKIMLSKIQFYSFGIVELIVAIGIFITIAAAGTVVVLGGFSLNRLGDEETEASLVAQEGLEAVRSIKNKDWANISNGTYGLDKSSGTWEFSGSSNVNGKFTRQVVIEDVQRNAEGNIVESGGTVDSSIKKVTARVNWNFSPTRANTVELTTYLANWEKPIPTAGDGMLVYSDSSGSKDVVKYKTYDGNNWGTESTIPDFGAPSDRSIRRVELYSSPASSEKILVTKHSGGGGQIFYAQVWDGSNWGNVVELTSYSDNTNPETRNFDGAYLDSGDFMVVYDDFTFTPKYRIWNGSNWSQESSTKNISGYPVWIIVRNSPGTNNVMVVVRNVWQHTDTIYWNGSSWSSPVKHGWYSTGFSRETISFEWSKNNSEIGVLMFNEWYDPRPNIRIWRENNSWSSSVENINVGGIARVPQIVSRPGADEFLGCVKDANRDINCLESDFTPLWSHRVRVATNTDGGNQRSFGLGYESQSGSIALAVYSEGGTSDSRRIPKYRTYNPSNDEWSSEESLPELGSSSEHALETVRVIPNPSSDNIMVLMGDTSQDLSTVVWDGDNNEFFSSGDNGLTGHGEFGSEDPDFWFDFEWSNSDGDDQQQLPPVSPPM